MIAKKILFITAFILMIVLVLEVVQAFAVGVSPPVVSFVLLKGGSQEKTFQASTNNELPMAFNVEIDDSIKEFIKINPENGEMQVGKPGEITITASAPRSAKPGNYSGAIIVSTKPLDNDMNGSGSKISTGIAVKVNIQVLEETESLLKSPVFLTAPILTILLFVIIIYFLKFRR